MQILVIEDEWLIASEIERTLLAAGIDIAGVAGSITRALKLVDATGADAAILDANLRGATAEPVAQALAGRHLPFLVISGYSSDEPKGILATRPFLRKPFSPQDLLDQVRRLIP